MDRGITMRTALEHERRLTYDDFLLFPRDGRRHELIDGAHVVSPAPSLHHQRIVGRLYVDISVYLRQHPGVGEAFIAPTDVVLSLFDVVEPDLVFVAADQYRVLTEAHVRGAPALVVEVLSPTTRDVDELQKYQLFAKSGVREYWILDPSEAVITVFRRGTTGRLPKASTLTERANDALTTPLLPGFSMALHDVFA